MKQRTFVQHQVDTLSVADHEFNPDFCKDDVHGFFGLTYANYFTMPRSILQSMPADWQHNFAVLMEQAEELYGGYEMDYAVFKRGKTGHFTPDELSNYERGRRYVEPRAWPTDLASTNLNDDTGAANPPSREEP